MAETLIEWTHRRHPKTGTMYPGFTFNPWIGCSKVEGSPACAFCYAAALDEKRFSKTLGAATPAVPISHWGHGAPRHRTGAENWKNPHKWNRVAQRAGMALAVFCASMSDIFDEEVSDQWRDDLFGDVILPCQNLDWLLLTKRTAKARAYLAARGCPPNIWMGATMENQPNFDRRIVDLLAIEGPRVYFASMEPLLGTLDPTRGLRWPQEDFRHTLRASIGRPSVVMPGEKLGCDCCPPPDRGLDWIIGGGESNEPDKTKSRPTHPDDALQVATAAWAAGIPFFWKQWGDWAPAYELDHNPQAQAMCLTGHVLKRDLGRGQGGRRLSFNVGKAAAGHVFEGEPRREMPAIRLLG